MMNMMDWPGMMLGMGIIGWLGVVALVLVVAALVKYLFFSNPKR